MRLKEQEEGELRDENVTASEVALGLFCCFSHVPLPFCLPVCMWVGVFWLWRQSGHLSELHTGLNLPIKSRLKYSGLPVTCRQIMPYHFTVEYISYLWFPVDLVSTIYSLLCNLSCLLLQDSQIFSQTLWKADLASFCPVLTPSLTCLHHHCTFFVIVC